MNIFTHFTQPLLRENPITVQILGLCSALAVSRSLEPALFMSLSVIAVLLFSNLSISLLRHVMPRSIRLIIEVTIIASAVIVVDELIRTFAPDVSDYLSVFVGLIITNCIILGRAETFAMHHGPLESLADALGNGIGYAVILIMVALLRELLGTGAILEVQILPTIDMGGWYRPNQIMSYASSAFFLIGFLIWGIRSWRIEQVEDEEYPTSKTPYRESS